MVLATVIANPICRQACCLSVKEKKVDSSVFTNKIIPVAMAFAISLVLANKAYIYLSVSYIQMLTFTPVAVLAFSFVAGLEKSSAMGLHRHIDLH